MVEIKNLSLIYNNNKNILNNISLSINKGECVLFTGKSGSGKSSIINSINGLAIRYDNAKVEGSILINGKSIKNLELYEISMLISTVFQNPKTYFFNVNTTIELLFFLENIGLDKEQMDIRLKHMLKLFPIEHLLNRDIFKLSGGEKQILCIAASYIAGTDIVVLDEPSSNLDNKNIEIIKNMLALLKQEGKSLIIAEHRIFYIMDIVDRIFLVEDGKISKEYSRDEFLQLSGAQLSALGIRDKKKTELKVPPITDSGDFVIKSLSYQFENTDKKLELSNLHFDFGNIYGIIGANGNGKSTLLKSLIGVDNNSKEEVYFKEKLLSKKERLKLSSLVMQDVNHQLFTDEVLKELSLAIEDFDQEKAEKTLEELGLTEFKNDHPMSLSGGQKQRVAIASVLFKGSKFIYFDEPTSGMDYSNMIKISELIKKSKNKDNIIFIVSHDIEFLNEVADFVLKI